MNAVTEAENALLRGSGETFSGSNQKRHRVLKRQNTPSFYVKDWEDKQRWLRLNSHLIRTRKSVGTADKTEVVFSLDTVNLTQK